MGHHQRLGIDGCGIAAGGIAHMTNGSGAGEGLEILIAKHIRHKAWALMQMEGTLVHRSNSGGLLTAVLESIQGSIDAVGGGEGAALFQCNAEYAALLAVLPG